MWVNIPVPWSIWVSTSAGSSTSTKALVRKVCSFAQPVNSIRTQTNLAITTTHMTYAKCSGKEHILGILAEFQVHVKMKYISQPNNMSTIGCVKLLYPFRDLLWFTSRDHSEEPGTGTIPATTVDLEVDSYHPAIEWREAQKCTPNPAIEPSRRRPERFTRFTSWSLFSFKVLGFFGFLPSPNLMGSFGGMSMGGKTKRISWVYRNWIISNGESSKMCSTYVWNRKSTVSQPT